MARHCIIFYDTQTKRVNEIKETFLFTAGHDSMTNYCTNPEDRLILGVILEEEDIARKSEMTVHFDYSKDHFGEGHIEIGNKRINIFKKENIAGKELIIDCDIFSGTGYGMLSREFMKRILPKNPNFRINPINSSGLFETCLANEDNVFSDRFISMEELNQLGDHIHMRFYPPKINFPKKSYNITYTMLESYTLNHFYMKMMDSSYEKFIVPTNFIKNVFCNYFSEDRISVVPLGIDLNVFRPDIPQEDVKFKRIDLRNKMINLTEDKPEGFKFLSVARFSHRKGGDLVLKGFANEFTKKDDVSLVLFFQPENENNPGHFHNRLLSILGQYDISNMPPIYLYDKPWPTNKQYLPYGWGDCFVFPSRGEGFGFTPMEAAACKMPVVSSNNSGLSDFISEETAFVVPTDKVESIGTLKPVIEGNHIVNYYYEGDHPEWNEDIFHQHTWECEFPIMFGKETIETIGQHMRFVYQNQNSDIVQNKINNFYDLIHRDYNWDILSDKLNEEIKKYQC